MDKNALAKPDSTNQSAPTMARTIREFCAGHRISRTHFHNLRKAGKGPRVMRLGRRVLITPEAEADWHAQLEQEAE
jgi:hypothetical protein